MYKNLAFYIILKIKNLVHQMYINTSLLKSGKKSGKKSGNQMYTFTTLLQNAHIAQIFINKNNNYESVQSFLGLI